LPQRVANEQANPELVRIAMKMATGSGKTTVMAMLIAWQTRPTRSCQWGDDGVGRAQGYWTLWHHGHA
jgi:hypothetical protein